jgi:hypothetical protein
VKNGKKWEKSMVIDCLQFRIANSKAFNFLKNNGLSGLELRLLLFWARHPHAKLSLYSIASALDTARISLRDAMASLVTKGVLVEQHCEDLTTYSISENIDAQECIKELSMMDWNQIKILENQLEGVAIFS